MERVDGEFYIPAKLADLEDPEKTLNGFRVDVVLDIHTISPGDRLATVGAILHELVSSSNTTQALFRSQEKFDVLYSYIKMLDQPGAVPSDCRLNLGRDLSQCLNKAVRSIAAMLASPKTKELAPDDEKRLKAMSLARSGIKMYCFLLAHLLSSTMSPEDVEQVEGFTASQTSGRGARRGRAGSAAPGNKKNEAEDGLDISARENCLRAFVEVLSSDLSEIWRGGQMDEALTNLLLRTCLHMVSVNANMETRGGHENPVAEGLLALLTNLSFRYTSVYVNALAIRERQTEGRPSGNQGPMGCPDPNNLIISPLVELMMKSSHVSKFVSKLIRSIDDGSTTQASVEEQQQSGKEDEEGDASPRGSTQSALAPTGGGGNSGDIPVASVNSSTPAPTWASKFLGFVFEAVAHCAIHDATGEAAKNIAFFLEDIASKHCSVVHSFMTFVLPMIGAEAYEIRKGTMTCLAEVLSQKYTRRQVVTEQQAITRDKYFEELIIRLMDLNPFVRMHCLKLWSSLCETKAVHKAIVIKVLKGAVDRLKDRHYLTRRAAMQLLESLIRANPFQQMLSIRVLTAKYEEHQAEASKFFETFDFQAHSANRSTRGSGRVSSATGRTSTIKLESTDDQADGSLFEAESQPVQESSSTEVTDFISALEAAREAANRYGATVGDQLNQSTTQLQQGFSSGSVTGNQEADGYLNRILKYEYGVFYVSMLHVALDEAVKMLTSKTQQDIVQAMHFIVVCALHRMDAAEAALKRILVMVFMHEPTVQKAVADSFVAVYFDAFHNMQASKLAKNVARVQKLVGLLNSSSEAEINSIEKILANVRASGNDVVDDSLLDAAWGVADGTLTDGNAVDNQNLHQDRRSALKLYSILCTSMPRDVTRKKAAIVTLMQNNPRDNALLASAFQALAKEALYKGYIPIDESIDPNEHSICQLALHHCCRPTRDLGQWIQLCDTAITCLHQLHSAPVILYNIICGYLAEQYSKTNDLSRLTQLLAVMGFTAMKQLVSIDNFERAQMKKIDDATQAEKLKSNASHNASGILKGGKAEDMDKMQKELGLGGSDYKRYEIQQQCVAAKKSMLTDKNSVWAKYSSLVVKTCHNFLAEEQKYSKDGQTDRAVPREPLQAILKTTSLIALVKLMIASEDFCKKHLTLLFTFLARKDQANVDKVNIVIGLGDLCCVHANALLPHMKVGDNGFYSLLSDPSAGVRGTAVQICTHLVLNDMLRVNENLHSIVKLSADPEPAIAHSASMFVRHLSIKMKGNIGNYIPPLVAKLSPTMEVEQFQVTLKVLLEKVEKDKPTESLIEKLCSRFQRFSETKNTVIKFCRNLAFCISELNFSSERTVKKIMSESCYNQYKQWLRDAEVYAAFQGIIKKAKHGAGNDRRDKGAIDEWEARLTQDANVEDEEPDNGADNGADDINAAADDLVADGLVDASTSDEEEDARPIRPSARQSTSSQASTIRPKPSRSRVDDKKTMQDEAGDHSSSSSSSEDASSSSASSSRSSSSESDEEDAPPKKRGSGKKTTAKKAPAAKKAAPKKAKGPKVKKEPRDGVEQAESSSDESEAPPRSKRRADPAKKKMKPLGTIKNK